MMRDSLYPKQNHSQESTCKPQSLQMGRRVKVVGRMAVLDEVGFQSYVLYEWAEYKVKPIEIDDCWKRAS